MGSASRPSIVGTRLFSHDLLGCSELRWHGNVIEDCVAEGDIAETWSAYHGKQQGDPVKAVDERIEVARRRGLPASSCKTAETTANLAFVFGKIVADVGDLEGAEDRSVRLAFKQEAKALFDQALCICFTA